MGDLHYRVVYADGWTSRPSPWPQTLRRIRNAFALGLTPVRVEVAATSPRLNRES